MKLFKQIKNCYHSLKILLSCSCSILKQSYSLSKIRTNSKFIKCAEAVTQICSVKKVFLTFLQNSQENTCARASFFNKVLGLRSEACNLIKNIIWHRDFPVNFAKFLKTYFLTEHLLWLLGT